jgi:hypothetical protein
MWKFYIQNKMNSVTDKWSRRAQSGLHKDIRKKWEISVTLAAAENEIDSNINVNVNGVRQLCEAAKRG